MQNQVSELFEHFWECLVIPVGLVFTGHDGPGRRASRRFRAKHFRIR